MLKLLRGYKAGDTIIEVLFAVTVFSLIAVGGISIMNQGITTSQRALEITLARQEIDAQAETLRFLHDSYVSAYEKDGTYSGPAEQWSLMIENIVSNGTFKLTDLSNIQVCPTHPKGGFIINTRTAQFIPSTTGKLQDASTYAKLIYENDEADSSLKSAEGIWIEAVRSDPSSTDSTQAKAGYIDFNILACWIGPGVSVPVTIGTVVRLYEPRG